MKQKITFISTIVLLVLIFVFMGVWIFKSKTPAMRPVLNANTSENGAWWSIDDSKNNTSDEWVLDPEIPNNYLPVPGEDNLFMVVDNAGKITKYRERIKQADGSWKWNDANPDIPDNYETTNLKDVYKVTDENGKESYFKYVRNEDDSYAFVPVDKNGKYLNDTNPAGDAIPDNYVHVSGNVYAVKDSNGVIVQYKERKKNDDGTYTWTIISKPSSQTGNTGSGTSSKPQNNENVKTEKRADGSYTETETITNTQISNGWKITYQTIVKRTYDAQGNLVTTSKQGPTEIKREQSQ